MQCQKKGSKRQSYLIVRKDDEGTATGRLDDDGEELGVDRAERGVPGRLGHPDVVVALFPLERGAVHVAELAGAHTERHVCSFENQQQSNNNKQRTCGTRSQQ